MTSNRKTYTPEFKQETVRLHESSGKPIYQIETDLDITHGLLNKWKRQLQQQGAIAFPGPAIRNVKFGLENRKRIP